MIISSQTLKLINILFKYECLLNTHTDLCEHY